MSRDEPSLAEKGSSFVQQLWPTKKLHRDFSNAIANADKYNLSKQEIEKLDREIDEQIYKLYNLSKEEIKVITNNDKN
jgi:hypothetical protein